MKKLLSFLILAVCLVATSAPALAAEIMNVGPRGDKYNSGDLNARRYSRMLDRWKAEDNTATQATASLQDRYNSAPQTVQLAQEDPSMPSMQAAPTCNCNCSGQPAAAARMPVQQQSLQPMYQQQQNNMMPPVTITGSQY